MKRRVKPKTLLLSCNSDRSIARLSAALAFTRTPGSEEPDDTYRTRQRAVALLEILRAMT